jgi:hypothetical protein
MNELSEIQVMTKVFGVFEPYSFFDLKKGDFFKYVGAWNSASRKGSIFFCDSDCTYNSIDPNSIDPSSSFVKSITLKCLEDNLFEIDKDTEIKLSSLDFNNQQIKLGNFWFNIMPVSKDKILLSYFIAVE